MNVEWMGNTAREIEAATQPLCHSARVADAATLAERLSGWGENFRHCALNLNAGRGYRPDVYHVTNSLGFV